jgi:hypothetical protein
MIISIELTEEEAAELLDLVDIYSKEHPKGPALTTQMWAENQLKVPLSERIDQQYVGLIRSMNRSEKKAVLGNLSEIKTKIKAKRGTA